MVAPRVEPDVWEEVWAQVGYGNSSTAVKNSRTEIRSLIFPPLPLARELKVVPKRTHLPCASGLRLRRSPGSADCPESCGTAARPSHSVIESGWILRAGQWHAPK